MNDFGQLGDGTTTNRSSPVTVSGLNGATQVALGFDFSCALLNDSTVKCWGKGVDGQLGNGAKENHTTPVTVSGVSNAVEISAGTFHACARINDGTVKCWGKVFKGCGWGCIIGSTPTQVIGISGAVQLSLS
jgi:hypothetical protein